MDAILRELEELHAGIVTWMQGACDDTDEEFDRLFAGRLDPDFTLLAPSGARLDGLAVRRGMRAAHASNPEFRIAISDVRVVTQGPEVVVATCIEWQRNAMQSTPPNNGRHLTVVFARDPEQPHGLRWLHLHESWLPPSEMAAKTCDF